MSDNAFVALALVLWVCLIILLPMLVATAAKFIFLLRKRE